MAKGSNTKKVVGIGVGVIIVIVAIAMFGNISQFTILEEQFTANEIVVPIPFNSFPPELLLVTVTRADGTVETFNTQSSLVDDTTCFVKTSLISVDEDGNRREVSKSAFAGGAGGSELTALDLVNRFSGIVFVSFDVELKARCDLNSDGRNTGNEFGWSIAPSTVSLVYDSDDLDGSKIFYPSQFRNVPEILLTDNIEFIIATFKIPSSVVEAEFSEHPEPYRTQIRTYVVGDVNFYFNQEKQIRYEVPIPFPQMYNTYLFNVEKFPAVETPVTVRNSHITIETIVQTTTGLNLISGVNELDTSERSGRQIKIIGLVRDWDASQGNPTIQIKLSNSILRQGTMTIEEVINDGQDGQFRFLYTPDQNSPEGTYDVFMQMGDRTTSSTRSFVIDNTEPSISNDQDGDGVVDADDSCPNLFGLVNNEGCPLSNDDQPQQTICSDGTMAPSLSQCAVPSVTCPDGVSVVERLVDCPEGEEEEQPIGVTDLEDEVIKGTLVTLTTITFDDNTTQEVLSTEMVAGITSNISELIPAELISTSGGVTRSISSVTIELFYFNDESLTGAVQVDKSILSVIPKVIESSVSEATGSPISLRNEDTGNLGTISGITGLGKGISLGQATIGQDRIIMIGEVAGITDGVSRDANIDFLISGTIDFKDSDEVQRFLVLNNLVSLIDVDINNEVTAVAPIVCLDSQTEDLDANGIVIGCTNPEPDAPTCFSNERPQGYACTSDDIIEFCNGDASSCTEKDDDGDGVPNFIDRCRNLDEDFDSRGDVNDGCPFTVTSVNCNSLVGCDTDTSSGEVCSASNPSACLVPIGEFDFEDILIFGAIGIVGLVILLVVVKVTRKPRILGT